MPNFGSIGVLIAITVMILCVVLMVIGKAPILILGLILALALARILP